MLRDWLTQFPEKVLFGSDAAALGPDMGWEVAAWIGTAERQSGTGLALTDMMRNGEVTPRAGRGHRDDGDAHERRGLYKLGLK